VSARELQNASVLFIDAQEASYRVLLGTHRVETEEQSRLGGELVDNQQAGHIEVAPPQVYDSGEFPPGWSASLHQT
jgi:hypothetical protein